MPSWIEVLVVSAVSCLVVGSGGTLAFCEENTIHLPKHQLALAEGQASPGFHSWFIKVLLNTWYTLAFLSFQSLSLEGNIAGKRIFGVFLSTSTVYIAERWRIQAQGVDKPGVWSQLCCLTSWMPWPNYLTFWVLMTNNIVDWLSSFWGLIEANFFLLVWPSTHNLIITHKSIVPYYVTHTLFGQNYDV